MRITRSHIFQWSLSLVAIAGLLLAAGAAFAQGPVTMAPPIDQDSSSAEGGGGAAQSVFNWQEIPANQQVPINQATFDEGGYQLYDTAGETIVVPFTNDNLYVMQFARSQNGTMYFVNEGDYPVLYVPRHGYLENAAISGARWYPFGKSFHPTQPVYLGIAPSWPAFVAMGWYSGMYCYGGYWCNSSFLSGGVFLPSDGLFFVIGGVHYVGWGGYHSYLWAHPAPYHTSYFNHSVYHWSQRPTGTLHRFVGSASTPHPYYAHQPFKGTQNSGGANHFGAPSGRAPSGGQGRVFGGSGRGGATGHGGTTNRSGATNHGGTTNRGTNGGGLGGQR